MSNRRRVPSLREQREKAGLTQDELAALMGVHRNTISNWERDVTTRRSVHLQRAWAHALSEADALPRLDSNQEPFGSGTAQYSAVGLVA